MNADIIKRLASIDIGTNTLRLLIADVKRNPSDQTCSIRELHSERVITRLGEGVHKTGRLDRVSMEKSLQVLHRFSAAIASHGVEASAAYATGALREAADAVEFLERIRHETGLNVTIISGDEEARITAAGMLMDIEVPEKALLIDIGGGSTEMVLTKQKQPVAVKSINLGVVHLTNEFMRHDPPATHDMEAMKYEIDEKAQLLWDAFHKEADNAMFIGTAGTITTLAAMSLKLTRFDHDMIHKSCLIRADIESIFDRIAHVRSDERAQYVPFEPERLDIIVPGTLILLTVMNLFQEGRILVSDNGLREGILIRLYHE